MLVQKMSKFQFFYKYPQFSPHTYIYITIWICRHQIQALKQWNTFVYRHKHGIMHDLSPNITFTNVYVKWGFDPQCCRFGVWYGFSCYFVNVVPILIDIVSSHSPESTYTASKTGRCIATMDLDHSLKWTEHCLHRRPIGLVCSWCDFVRITKVLGVPKRFKTLWMTFYVEIQAIEENFKSHKRSRHTPPPMYLTSGEEKLR